jgi:hypothetical protein
MTQDLTASAARARASDIGSIAAAAELHMLDALRIPPSLLPSALDGNPIQPVALAVRRLCVRRARLLSKMATTASSIAGHAAGVAEVAADGRAPVAPVAVDVHDVDALTDVRGRLAELDHVLDICAAMLRDAGGRVGTATPPWETK